MTNQVEQRRKSRAFSIDGESSGQGLVEFALTLPIFIVLLFGLINGGWLLFQQQSVINSARSAARDAAVLNPLFVTSGSTGCEPTSSQASPAIPIETAAQQGSMLVPINTSQICASSTTASTMTSSTTQSGKATVTVTASPTLASANTVTVTVSYTTSPLTPVWLAGTYTLSSTSSATPQSSQ